MRIAVMAIAASVAVLSAISNVRAGGQLPQRDLWIDQVVLQDGNQWILGEGGVGRPFMVTLILSNHSNKAITIWDFKNSEGSQAPAIVLKDEDGKQTILHLAPVERAAGVPTTISIAPTQTIAIEMELLRLIGPHALPTGKYQLHATFENTLKTVEGFVHDPVWTGAILSNEMPMEIVAPKGSATQPSAGKATRTSQLRAGINTFTLFLEYHGPQDKPFYQLTLSVPELPAAKKNDPFDLRVHITPDQANKIVDYLRTDGFLVKATDETNVDHAREMNTADGSYIMVVGTDRCQFIEDLGPGDPMLQRLSAMRTVLDGTAKAGLETLLKRMGFNTDAPAVFLIRTQ